MKRSKTAARGARKPSPVQQLREQVRAGLHSNLDELLASPATLPDGSQGTVHDDVCLRALAGLALSVRISVEDPRSIEAGDDVPTTSPPESLIVLP